MLLQPILDISRGTSRRQFILPAPMIQRLPEAKKTSAQFCHKLPTRKFISATRVACLGMQGQLVKYGPGSSHTAFISGPPRVGLRHVVLVGGLSDGLLFAGYVEPLSQILEQHGWCLVQPLLSSSYGSWGVASLDQDADELLLLLTFLRSHQHSQGVVIIGHSTGCQDAVRYVARHKEAADAAPLLGIILQAPVSDRECFACDLKTLERTAAARTMIAAGKDEDIAFRDDDGTPVTARRWLSLVTVNGDDDMFSSDFTAAQLQENLKHMEGTPTLVMLSGADEYMPKHVLKEAGSLAERLAAAMGATASRVVIPSAKHALEGAEELGVKAMMDFVNGLAL